MAKSLQLEA